MPKFLIFTGFSKECLIVHIYIQQPDYSYKRAGRHIILYKGKFCIAFNTTLYILLTNIMQFVDKYLLHFLWEDMYAAIVMHSCTCRYNIPYS